MTSKILRHDGTELTGIKSVIYKTSVNSDTDLRPGCVSSASIDVTVYGTQTSAVNVGEELTYYRVSESGTETLIGKFYAEPTIQTRNTYSFTAYDAASKTDADFSERLESIQEDFPMSLYDLVLEACSVSGVTLSGSFPLSTIEVQAFYANNISCRQILSWAAEIACRFVRCDQDGNLRFDWYETENDYRVYYTDGNADGKTNVYYKQDGLQYENYSTAALDRVAVRPSDTEGAAYIYPQGTTAGNTLEITNNTLLNNADETVYMTAAQHIFTVMSQIGPYRPAQIKLFPFNNPFSVGQIISVADIQGVSFVTPVMSMTVQDDVALLVSAGHERLSEKGGTLKDAITQLADSIVKISKLKVDWAEIGTAIVETLEAVGIDADWIAAKSIAVQKLAIGDPTNYVTVFPQHAKTMLPENHVLGGTTVDDGFVTKLYLSQTHLGLSDLVAGAFSYGDELSYGLVAKASQNTTVRLALIGYAADGQTVLDTFESEPIPLTTYEQDISGVLYARWAWFDDEGVLHVPYGYFENGKLVADHGHYDDDGVLRFEEAINNWSYFALALVDESGAQLYVKDASIMRRANADLIVDGAVTAKKISVDDLYALAATIGGFHIGETAIYSLLNRIGGDGNIYLGQDGLSIGDNFKALADGSVEMTGTVRTGGEDVFARLTEKGIAFFDGQAQSGFWYLPWPDDTSKWGMSAIVSQDDDTYGTDSTEFFAIGIQNVGDSGFTPGYALNNGLNPNGRTERNLLCGDTWIESGLTIGDDPVPQIKCGRVSLTGAGTSIDTETQVRFAVPFSDANYVVQLTPEYSGALSLSYALTVTGRNAGYFSVVSRFASNVTITVHWTAMKI